MSEELFTKNLLSWYEKNKRDHFPWRKTTDPYKILIAEMMLQKTTAEQVKQIFEQFITKYPAPEVLAKASIVEIETIIRPLGMEHIRANRIKKLAEDLVSQYNGQVPADRKRLISLYGVGNYIANATLVLAFNQPLPLIDTNSIRLLERCLGVKSSKIRPRTDKELWNKVQQMIPENNSKPFNLGLIDFGALVCTAKNPKCENCPMFSFCEYIQKNSC